MGADRGVRVQVVPAPRLIGLPVNAQHRHRGQAAQPDDGPPTDEFVLPVAPRRGGKILGALRSRRVVVLAAVGAALVVVAVVVLVVARSGPADDAAAPHALTYQASSTGKSVIVTFTRGAEEVDGQAAAPSPWSLATAVNSRVAVLTVNSGDPNRADGVTCAILDTNTGRTLVKNSAPPATGGSVTCVTGNLKP